MMKYEYTHCLICDSFKHQVIAERDRRHKPLRVAICRDCGFVFVNPLPREKDLDDFYAHSYREQYKKTRQPKSKHVLRSGRRVMKRIRFLKTLPLPEDASVLDVGTGIGVFVYLARKAGFRAEGLEPHQGYASYGTSVLNVKIQNKTLGNARIEQASLDAVVMHHVLEHLRNPLEAMKKAHEFLKDSGLLIIEVPNIMGRYHAPNRQFHLAHLHYFSPWTLKAVASRAGFSLQSLRLHRGTKHILAVFEKAETIPFPAGQRENYEKTRAKLKDHTVFKHYLTPYPYTRPVQKIFQSLSESIGVIKVRNPRRLLDTIYACQTKSISTSLPQKRSPE